MKCWSKSCSLQQHHVLLIVLTWDGQRCLSNICGNHNESAAVRWGLKDPCLSTAGQVGVQGQHMDQPCPLTTVTYALFVCFGIALQKERAAVAGAIWSHIHQCVYVWSVLEGESEGDVGLPSALKSSQEACLELLHAQNITPPSPCEPAKPPSLLVLSSLKIMLYSNLEPTIRF